MYLTGKISKISKLYKIMLNLKISDKKPEPAYMQIKQSLEAYIEKENLKAGTMLPDVKTIAKLARVSVRTAFKGIDELVKEGVCYRRPKKGTFVNKKSVDKIDTKKIIGVYNLNFDLKNLHKNIVSAEMYRGISEEAEKKNYDTFFFTGKTSESIEFYKKITQLSLNGIIALHSRNSDEIKSLSEKFKELTFVALNYRFPGMDSMPDNVFSIYNDDFSGAYQMGEHLLQEGFERLALVSLELPEDNYRERVRGYKAAWRNNGLHDPATMSFQRSNVTEQYDFGKTAAAELLSGAKRPEVIACVNDMLAEGVATYLRENKIDDVKVVGYDNVMRALSKDNNFSTVSIDFERMGSKAVELINSKDKNNYPQTLTVSPQLIIRK